MAEAIGKITLWGIEVFIATAEEQSISTAARRLGASPSSVSQQLSNLEAAVGAVLINRSERPVKLTQAGEVFRRRAQVIIAETMLAKSELTQMDQTSLTQLRLGMIEDFDAGVTPSLLADLAGDMAGTRFLLETGASHRLFDQLDARALDVVVAAEISAPAKWMEVHSLLRDPFVAVLPKGTDVNAAVAQLPLIQYTTRHHMGRVLADHLARQNLTLAHRFELDSYHAIMAMVASGAGWTILTALGVTHARRFLDRVDIVELPFAPLSRVISLSARRDVIGDMPQVIAARLRELLQEQVVTPGCEQLPWLQNQLVVL